MKIESLPVMKNGSSKDYIHHVDDILSSDLGYFGDLWHMHDEYTNYYLFYPDELPDIFSEASIFAFAYGALLGEFTWDPSPYPNTTKNIIKFRNYLKRFYDGKLIDLINHCIETLNKYPDDIIKKFDQQNIDGKLYHEILNLVWSKDIKEFLWDTYKDNDYLRTDARNYFLENMPLQICKDEDEYYREMEKIINMIPDYSKRINDDHPTYQGVCIPRIFHGFLIQNNERMLGFSQSQIRMSANEELAKFSPLQLYKLKTTHGDRLVIVYQDVIEVREYDSNESIALIINNKRQLYSKLWSFKEAKGWTYDKDTKILKKGRLFKRIIS